MNKCQFSKDRVYRYTLSHQFKKTPGGLRPKTLAVIGLNPSTADEQQLDPTLKKVRGFAERWGYERFIMLNLFAFRATLPKDMRAAEDPVGPDNDKWIRTAINHPTVDRILLAWGAHGSYLGRDQAVKAMLLDQEWWNPPAICALRLNGDGSPMHPLYVPYDTTIVNWP